MVMIATVIQIESRGLLVRDSATGNEVRVFVNNPRRFSRGDRVRITYSGAMTHSIPPQITALAIQRMQDPAPHPPSHSSPSEMRAIVLQRRSNALLVRDMRNNRQALVNYRYAHHFCNGQRITVHYDMIRMNNPVEISARDITPIC